MATRRNVPPGWAVMEHRAVQYRPMPLGMPFPAAVAVITAALMAVMVFGEIILTAIVGGGLLWLAKKLASWHPFGWLIMIKNFTVPRVLWS